MKKVVALLLASALFTTVTVPTHASWLSKTLDRLTSPVNQESVDSAPSQQSERWIKVEENSLYTTYVDRRTFKAEGTAQYRKVSGYFKREFTPVGSQWLGNNSNGRVKPDTITYSIYHASYGVNSCQLDSASYSIYGHTNYYDVNGNLIYTGYLPDLDYQKFGRYIPDSMQEKLKDRLFHAVGWDY